MPPVMTGQTRNLAAGTFCLWCQSGTPGAASSIKLLVARARCVLYNSGLHQSCCFSNRPLLLI